MDDMSKVLEFWPLLGLLIPVLGYIAAKTKNKWDDRLVSFLKLIFRFVPKKKRKKK